MERTGETPPPAPTAPPGLEWVWIAWHRLDADRPYRPGGMGPGIPAPIPWRDVVEWCSFHDLAGDDVEFLDACFREMDAEFLTHHAAQIKAAMK